MNAHIFDRLLKAVGGFGYYQKRLLFLMCLSTCCVYLQNDSPIFTMKIPRHRCRIPGLDNDTYEIHSPYHAFLVNRTIPLNEKGGYSECSVYDATGGDDVTETITEIPCDDWVFDYSVFGSNYVTEFQLVCQNKIYRSHSTMMVFIGKFVGAMCNSLFGDYFGRRRVYLVMLIALTASGLGLVFVSSLPAFMVLRFFAGATTTGSYLPVYVITMELLGTSQRRLVSVMTNMTAILGALLATLFAYFFKHWSHFQACLVGPCFLLFLTYWLIPESPRWLFSKNRFDEGHKIVQQVAKMNGVTDLPTMDSEFMDTKDGEMSDTTDNSADQRTPAARVTPFQLFRVPRLLLRYTLLYCSWILLTMCLYGLNLNVTNMSGNLYLNFSIMTGVEFISIVAFAVLVERMGRRLFLLVASSMGGMACLLAILPAVLGGDAWITRGLSFVGKMGVSGSFSAIYVLSPELFPTVLRSFGLGSCSMLARIGGMASPYVADLNTYVGGIVGSILPQIVFGVAGIVTTAMIFLQPETGGRLLPETVRDAELFGRSEPDSQRTAPRIVATPLLRQEAESIADKDNH